MISGMIIVNRDAVGCQHSFELADIHAGKLTGDRSRS